MAGYARNRSRLEQLVEEAPADGAIDRDALLAAIERAALGVHGDALMLGRLDITLAYLHWLAGWKEWIESTPRSFEAEVFARDSERF